METNRIYCTDALTGLREMPSEFVQTIITSPPYYGLRNYSTPPFAWPAVSYSVLGFPVEVAEMSCELGQEPNHMAFIGHLVLIFREAKRTLKKDGTLWVNLGDSYAASGKNRTEAQAVSKSNLQGGLGGQMQILTQKSKGGFGLKNKDLIGIPWLLAYALRDDGWFLRMDVIWAKPNPMPESVTDRPTKSHEYIFLLSKSKKYYYDHQSIKTPAKESSIARLSQDLDSQTGSSRVPGKINGPMKAVGGLKSLPDGQSNIRASRDKQRGHSRKHAGFNARWDSMSTQEQMSLGANKRSVWNVATRPFKEAHFATFPEELITDPIKASSRIGDIVMDCFSGAGTTALVAKKLGRQFIGMELNPGYIKMSEKRFADYEVKKSLEKAKKPRKPKIDVVQFDIFREAV